MTALNSGSSCVDFSARAPGIVAGGSEWFGLLVVCMRDVLLTFIRNAFTDAAGCR